MRKGRRERMRTGAIISSSPQGMTSWSSSIKITNSLAIEYRFFGGKYCILLFKLIECIIKMSWCETKICAIGEQNVIN